MVRYCDQHRVKSEEEDCSHNEETESDIQHDNLMKTGTEWPHFPFTGKLGLKFEIQNSENLLNFSNNLLSLK